MLRIGIVACAGRMGRMLLKKAHISENVALSGGYVRAGHEAVGKDLGHMIKEAALHVQVTDDIESLCETSDVIIDFSRPALALNACEAAAKHKIAFVTGTTGFTASEKEALQHHARNIAMVSSANMSVGIIMLADTAKRMMASLGEEYKVDIWEMHHHHKVDAPSGTALMLKEAVIEGQSLFQEKKSVDITSARGGDIIGEHRVFFTGLAERLEYSHVAYDRGIFALGAMRAAKWVVNQAPGLYDMRDVLGLSTTYHP